MTRSKPSPALPRWAGLPVFGSLALLSLTTAAAFEIEVEEGLVSADAANAPLDAIVETLANASGLRLVRREPLQRRVDLRLDRRPLTEALDELLQAESYLLLLPGESDAAVDLRSVPGTLWIFTEGSDEAASAIEFFETVLLQGGIGEKKAAIRELRRLGTRAAVRSLSLALGDPDERARAAAMEALTTIGSDEALAALASAAAAGEAAARADAAESIAMAGGPSARAYLALALGDDDPLVRAAAVESLGDLGDARSRDILRTALADPDAEVRKCTVEILEELDDEAMFRTLFPAE